MKIFPFTAMLSRMKYIARWGLMRSNRTENLSEHTAETAQLAHVLALLAKEKFGKKVRPNEIAVVALYHDASEIITGDLPTPVKYNNDQLKTAYKKLEREAELSFLPAMPSEIREAMQPVLTTELLTEEEYKLMKAADKLSALIKCLEEEESGNKEFVSAKAEQIRALQEMHLQEVDYFMECMLPAYSYTLDELMREAKAPAI